LECSVGWWVDYWDSLYVEICVVENVVIGIGLIVWVCVGSIEIGISLCVMFSVAVPLFVSFISGVWVVKMKPGLIDRIWVWFVESWIVKFCWIVFDLSSSVSLYRMSLIWIVKFPSRVV